MDSKPNFNPPMLVPPLFQGLLAVLLSFVWLIPNHNLPWAWFYQDALTATVLFIVSVWLLIRLPGKLELIGPGMFFLFLAIVPWIQFAAGIIHSSGVAWINSLYLLGFSLTIFVGWHWERAMPGQCLDFLFLAICLAATISVGVQLLQWLQLSSDVLVMQSGPSRFSANLAQPNQLASLLLMAVVGLARGCAKKAVWPSVAILLVLFLLFGVALTDSKTAWLNMTIIAIALLLFWNEGRPKHFAWILLAMCAYFVLLQICIPLINEHIFGEVPPGRALMDSFRLNIWMSLLFSLQEHPWFGYGWGQTIAAVFAAKDFPNLGSVTMHAHNLILDIFLYNGLLLGVVTVAVMAVSLWQFARRLNQADFIFPALVVVLLLVHSMLELPLHYAYFLLPFGLIFGLLLQRSEVGGLLSCPKWVGYGVFAVVAYGLWGTIQDYIEVDRRYFQVRYGKDWKYIPSEFIPRVTALTQWRDRLQIANSISEGTLDAEKRHWVEGAVIATPEPFLMYLVAQNLALDGRPVDAKKWLENVCKMLHGQLAANLEAQWAWASETNFAYRAVDWKSCPVSEASLGNAPLLPGTLK